LPPPRPRRLGRAAAPLLKQYQEEIDSLTKRARHAEGAYLELYQELYEVGRGLYGGGWDPGSCRRGMLVPDLWGAACAFAVGSPDGPPARPPIRPGQAPDPASALSAAVEAQAHSAQLEAQVGTGEGPPAVPRCARAWAAAAKREQPCSRRTARWLDVPGGPPQVRKLSTELAEYKAESKAIKNQDLTIRKQVRGGRRPLKASAAS
jgi:hypothetical protein